MTISEVDQGENLARCKLSSLCWLVSGPSHRNSFTQAKLLPPPL